MSSFASEIFLRRDAGRRSLYVFGCNKVDDYHIVLLALELVQRSVLELIPVQAWGTLKGKVAVLELVRHVSSTMCGL
jgi:hypothetical protein